MAVLEPYIPQLIEHELTLRASLVSTLERLVDCGACGGAAAGSLWFARFLQARYQVWTMLCLGGGCLAGELVRLERKEHTEVGSDLV